MCVEFEPRPGILGALQTRLATSRPDIYSRIASLIGEVEGIFKYPYLYEISAGGISAKMMVNNRREQSVIHGPCFEKEFIEEMLACIQPGEVICDIGAATGTHALLSAVKTGEKGVVHAFEPDQQRAKALQKNICLNRLRNVVVHQVAVWDKDETLALHTEGINGPAPQVTGIAKTPEKYFRRLQAIPARSLSSWTAEEPSFRTPQVVKIDVEGGAFHVLLGMDNLRPRDIFLEVHPQFGENRAVIVALLKSRGYRIASEIPRKNQIHIHFSLSHCAIPCAIIA